MLAAPRPVLEVIASASQEVRSGIVYATMIVILVFIPLSRCRASRDSSSRRWGSPTSSRSSPPGHLDHRHAGACLLPVVGQDAAHHGDTFVVKQLKRGNAALLQVAFRQRILLFTTVALAVGVAAYRHDPAATRLPTSLQRGNADDQPCLQSGNCAR